MNFWDIDILSAVTDIGSFSMGGKCGLRVVVGGVLGWNLFRAKPSGLNLEAQFTSGFQFKSYLRKSVN